jgi:thiosulfate/3-mercaptopyruvate sulfurtransferase
MRLLPKTLLLGFTITILTLINTGFALASTPLVSADWLSKNLQVPELIIIDLRNSLDGGGYETFLEGHIPGSIHSDYMQAGWRVTSNDIPGLIPSEEQFQTLARSLGVNQNSHVIIVPAGVSSTDFGSSARVYWTFKSFGHEKISILNGGWANWNETYPSQIERGAPIAPENGNFTASLTTEDYIDTKGVEQVVMDKISETILLDGRPEKQFWGEEKHPKVLAGGHLPGATLLTQSKAYDEINNKLKSTNALNEIYKDMQSKPVVSYCNTGHWAAMNWFVLSELLGNENVTLYDGSMVEWTKDSNRPLTTEKSNFTKIKEFFRLG